MEDYIPLKNQKSVKIIENLKDLISGDENYLIEDEKHERYTISAHDFSRLVLKQSFTDDEKLDLYLSYFSGRQDVFAYK